MNRTALKTYAPKARLEFIRAVTDRAAFFGLTPDRTEAMQETGDVVLIGGRAFPRVVAEQRKKLQERIARHGFDQVMEAMAYTWFNRFVALRYMELHGYLDHGYRVLSHPAGKATPEILDHAEHVSLPGLDAQQVIDLKLDGTRDAELYRLLLAGQCLALHQALPFVFGKIDDETELLLPDNLLHTDSLIRQLVDGSEEADWDQVEVLGWLYQFYISERKDQVMARKSAVPTEDIPAVTQLFTPHWIVRYLVENSLGRLWLLNHPQSKLRGHMPYYIEGEEVAAGGSPVLKITKPEEIRLCDPAVGSGHMLTYAFDLLTLIYEEEGYAPTEIPALILRHNLHGLEICPRAAQLAELALVFKAREKSRRFFQPEHLVRPRIVELRDVRFAENELRDYIHALGLGDLFNQPMLRLLHQFEEAKNFGSLIQPCLDGRAIADVRRAIEAKDLGGQLFLRETHLKVLRVLEQAEALTQRYHVVVANPPYMGGSAMNPALKSFIEENWGAGKADTYAAFILRNLSLVLRGGLVGMITIPNWLSIDRFEVLRKTLLQSSGFSSLIHCGRGVWGSDFGSCAFVLSAQRSDTKEGVFRRLFLRGGDVQSNDEISANFFDWSAFPAYRARNIDFDRIPGTPIAYWASEAVRRLFTTHPDVESAIDTREGLATADNERFLRRWTEVEFRKIVFDCESMTVAKDGGGKWFPYIKGGEFRKWYGNTDLLVNWQDDGAEIRRNIDPLTGRLRSHNYNGDYAFRRGLTWSGLSIGGFSVRFVPVGFKFDATGPMGFAKSGANLSFVIGFLNSAITQRLLQILAPTVHFKIGQILKLPLSNSTSLRDQAEKKVDECVTLSRADWDNFETSWDFRDQPLLRPGLKGATLEASWRNWEEQSTAAIRRMQELETENNRLFIAAYGLEGELQPEVPEAQITLARAEARRDMAAFLSYAVGCMMGRYSPDHPGLILANAGESQGDFPIKVGKPLEQLTFVPDEDGIIPITELPWFRDDAAERFFEFLAKTWPVEQLEANLRFIADSLGYDQAEAPRESVRHYLVNSFYKGHLSTYKKRPIYWLFSSGKQKAFQCLVYLHRYHEGTLARMRTEYVIPLQGKLSHRIEQLAGDITAATSTSHRRKLEKERDTLVKQRTELAAFDEKLRHYADQRIPLDLDDGVKVNYAKFGDLLAEVKAVTGGGEE